MKAIILEMLDTIDKLGHSPTARLDARVWAKHWRRKLKRFGYIRKQGEPYYKSVDRYRQVWNKRAGAWECILIKPRKRKKAIATGTNSIP